MDVRIIPQKLSGTVTPPPSKSMAHRLLIAAAGSMGLLYLGRFLKKKYLQRRSAAASH